MQSSDAQTTISFMLKQSRFIANIYNDFFWRKFSLWLYTLKWKRKGERGVTTGSWRLHWIKINGHLQASCSNLRKNSR